MLKNSKDNDQKKSDGIVTIKEKKNAVFCLLFLEKISAFQKLETGSSLYRTVTLFKFNK